MKAMSIRNPWPYLIAGGIKDVENRSRRTNYRGRFYIHVSQKWDKRQNNFWKLFTKKQWRELDLKLGGPYGYQATQTEMTTSAIIGEAAIIDCIDNSKSIWAEPGKWHYILKNATLYEKPILNVKGKTITFWEYVK